MNHRTSFFDFAELPLQHSPRPSISSLTSEPDSSSILFTQFPSPPTPATSRPPSDIRALDRVSDTTTTLALRQPVIITFSRGSRLFKLRYTHIDVCKDPAGNLKCLELTESSALQGPFVHGFPNSRRPIPHLERPTMSGQKPSFRVSFLEEQTVQTAHTLFPAQTQYEFENWDDCVRFQEALLDQAVMFVAGIAEAKSKGRGEECISQNLRVLRAHNGRQSILFFANSQRKEKKRYLSIPLDAIERIEQSKKPSRPISLRLRANSELLAQLKTLQIQFLEENDQKVFFGILCQGVGYQTSS